jgi:starvation-inducible DNA-binding protein
MPRTDEAKREDLGKGLGGLLADTYVLYHSTQACHWNVDGPQFSALHRMFEEQYTEMAGAIDVIAERLRAIGYYTPSTLAGLTRLARIQQPDDLRGAEAMLSHLIEAHSQVVHRCNEVRALAEHGLDEATTDLLIERLRVHEKTLWMLRSQAGRHSEELKLVGKMAQAS